MKIIAAYPCLGKTTIYSLNKGRCFDREFNESRSTMGMTSEQTDAFFEHCAEIIKLQFLASHHDILFITEDDRLIYKLIGRIPKIEENLILVFPDASNEAVMADYKRRVIERSGEAWYKRVIEPEQDELLKRIQFYIGCNYDVRLTDMTHPYIEDVVALPAGFVLPERTEKKPIYMRDMKLVAFDFDDTLAFHVDREYTEHRGDGDEYFKEAYQNPLVFFDDIERCIVNKPLYDMIGYCRNNSIPMYCISKMRFSLHMEAKKAFLREYYGNDIEFISASSHEIKNDILRILCQINVCKPSEALLIDDLAENVDRANDAEYNAILAPLPTEDSWSKNIMVSANRSLFEYMDD